MSCCAPCRVASHLEDWIRVLIHPEMPSIPCRTGGLELEHGQEVVVDLQDGQFVGTATVFACPVLRPPSWPGGRVVRPAGENDVAAATGNRRIADDIESYLRRRTRTLGLDLKPVAVRVPLNSRKAIVFFTAEQRIDFRPLLKELGGRFRRRVEMRPFGVRDGAKLSGGLGPCGRCLCCSTFMPRFHSVTVRMAKRQNLSLNPAKISGLCGRLMCCLAHEYELYPPRRRSHPEPAPTTAG